MKKAFASPISTTIAVFACTLAATAAFAGPPLICWHVETGGAKSLPWHAEGSAFDGSRADYDRSQLVRDTFDLLAPDVPVIVRMETIRRAALYAARDPKVAENLLSRMIARARESGEKGNAAAMAWFDAGYLVEAYKQTDLHAQAGVAKRVLDALGLGAEGAKTAATPVDGYQWIQKAGEIRGPDPEIEYAAALVSRHPRRPEHELHLARAAAGASERSLLAKNLLLRFGDRGRTLPELRASLGPARH